MEEFEKKEVVREEFTDLHVLLHMQHEPENFFSCEQTNKEVQQYSTAISQEAENLIAMENMLLMSRHKKPKKANTHVVSEDYICDDEDNEVIHYITSSAQDFELVHIDDITLKRSDFNCLLQDGEWLDDKARAARKSFEISEGDHVTLIYVYRAAAECLEKSKNANVKEKTMEKALNRWCWENFINNRSLRHARDVRSNATAKWIIQGSCDHPERGDASFIGALPNQAGLRHLHRVGPDEPELCQEPDPNWPSVAR